MSPTDFAVPDDVIQYLRGRLRRGELGLFTGAGFSLDAIAADGQSIPSVDDLKAILWPIGFDNEPLDPDSSLADTFDAALDRSPSRLKETLESCLRVDSHSLPEYYESWFSIPWRRIYTLNIDDLDSAAIRNFDLPIQYEVLSYRSAVPSQDASTWIVHLNGTLEDFPQVTFSAPQYAERLPGREPWYATLSADLLNNTFVYVGTSLDESPLWQHIELRGTRTGNLVELRPRSFLVTPTLPAARRRLLQRYNLEWIPLTGADFARQVFPALEDDAAIGIEAVRRRQSGSQVGRPYEAVNELRAKARPASKAQYLLGRDPHWSDITDGHAILRAFETRSDPSATLLAPRYTLFSGTAGTGKTTTLMRACLELEAAGKSVAWVDTSAEIPVRRFHDFLRDEEIDVLAIDDLDTFATQAAPLAAEILRRHPDIRILAAARSSRADRFGLLDLVEALDGQNIVVPPLEDSDIDLLLEELASAGVAGVLRGLPFGEQRRLLRDHCGRQLLVSMIEVTSGRTFAQRIEDECHQLEPDSRFIYSIVALATSLRSWISKQELLVASGRPDLETLNQLDRLVRQHLVTEASPDQLSLRHRVVAEGAVDYFRRERHLAAPIRGLIIAMATQEGTLNNRSSRQFRLLRRLINHKFLTEEIGDILQVRTIYDDIKELLKKDYHYYLQRGSLEVEVGELDLAENYLEQAMGLNDRDFRVHTAHAYMSLKRASRDAGAGISGWRERADKAFEDLGKILEERGREDSYPWHILGSQGLAYVRRAPLQPSEKAQILDMLRGRMDQALRLHSGSADLKKLHDDIEREYLFLTVGDGADGDVADPDEDAPSS